jgi:N-acyl-D-aspartate/D-glutamate deacylase
MLIHEISGDDQQQEFLIKYIRHSLGAFCTDAEDYGHGHTHPAAYGAFTRILSHFVASKRVISFEQAIRKMTSYPAQLFGIRDRGLVRVGMAADLALVNRRKLADRATLASPRRTANGLEYLLLNGQIAIEQGLYKNSYGKVIRKQT